MTLAVALRSWGFTWGLYNANVSRRPHPDEWPVYWLFHWFGANHNLDPCPLSRSACFFDWGMVYPYAAYIFHLALTPLQGLVPAATFGPQADTEFIWAVIAGRATSLVFSAATIIVLYRLGCEAFSPDVGIGAALVGAVSGLMMQLAHFATPDSTTTFLLSCALLLCLRASNHPTTARFAAAGAVLGLATGSEYHMALLGLPLLVAWWVNCGARASTPLVVAVIAALATYVGSNVYGLVHLPDFIAATEHTLRIRTVDSNQQYGDRWAAFGPVWLYVVRYPLGYGVGFALTAWMLVGTFWSLTRRTRADWILLSWLIAYFVLVTLSPAKFMRYSAPLLPVLVVFSARAAVDLARYSRRFLRAFVRILVVAALAVSLLYDAAYAGLFAVTDSRVTALRWIAQRSPHGAFVTFDQLPNGLINVPYFFDSGRYRPCFALFETSALANPARYLVTDSYDGEEHPRITQATVDAFQSSLRANGSYRMAFRVDHTPTVLGLYFPIDSSPHDWRYPSHVITIYQKSPVAVPAGARTCFTDLSAAHRVLYPRSVSTR